MTLQQKQLYRSLMNTIDFFSQRLHTEQIVHYGYKIFEDLTLPKSAAIYILNNTRTEFLPQEIMGYEELPNVQFDDIHDEFARKNGFLLDGEELQKRYFKDYFIDTYNIDIILPLIIEDKLFGFVISHEDHESDGIKDREFLNRFNDLLNLSLEKAEHFKHASEMKKEISKRKFNLDSFSQTMDILMTALDQQYIIKMCLDVIRELTASSVTAIALESRENYLTIAGYKDIVNQKECFLELILKEYSKPSKVIYHIQEDYTELTEIFENAKELNELEAEYVVFLVKEKILGCITIGAPVSEIPYDGQILDQIKSLASIMYIAINNANQFKALTEERNKMSEQIMSLKHLNKSIATINGADSLEELCSHVIDTLSYGFGVESGFIWVQKNHEFCYQKVGGSTEIKPSAAVQEWLQQFNESYFDFTIPLQSEVTNEQSNCLVCIPILQQDYEASCLGYLLIDKLNKPLNESMTIIFETLVNSITPVIKHFLTIKNYQNDFMRQPESMLKELYLKYEEELAFFELSYSIYAKKKNNQLFSDKHQHEVIPEGDKIDTGSISVIFATEPLEDSSYNLLDIKDFNELKEQLLAINDN